MVSLQVETTPIHLFISSTSRPADQSPNFMCTKQTYLSG